MVPSMHAAGLKDPSGRPNTNTVPTTAAVRRSVPVPALLLLCTVAMVGRPASATTGPAASGPSTAAPLCGKGPLEILLTNDDGYETPGIRALYGSLRAAGHRVLLVAPDRNASGSSTSFTWAPVRITRDPLDPNVVGITGTPATSVVMGVTALYPPGRRPDLVISGINKGENIGSTLVLSGTIGATLAGTTLLDPPVPGIAVNSARPGNGGSATELPADHVGQLAGHLTELLAQTRGWFCEDGRVTRDTVVLNVNYPARPLGEMQGVRVATQGRTADVQVTFNATGESTYESQASGGPERPDAADSDVELLRQGYITVTPIAAVLDGRRLPYRDLRRRLAR
jgi:5'/3'-nucleotidase SurE